MMSVAERLTPGHGRPRPDVKQVKIPETAYEMLHAFAEAHNLPSEPQTSYGHQISGGKLAGSRTCA